MTYSLNQANSQRMSPLILTMTLWNAWFYHCFRWRHWSQEFRDFSKGTQQVIGEASFLSLNSMNICLLFASVVCQGPPDRREGRYWWFQEFVTYHPKPPGWTWLKQSISALLGVAFSSVLLHSLKVLSFVYPPKFSRLSGVHSNTEQ